MSLAITHFALGAAVALIAAHAFGIDQYDSLVILVGAGWAMIPDLEKFIEHDLLIALHDSLVANIFVLHRSLDVADPADEPIVALGALVVFALVVVTTTIVNVL